MKLLSFLLLFIPLSSFAGLGDGMVFQPKNSGIFEKCKTAQPAGYETASQSILGTKEKIRIYFKNMEDAKAVVLIFHGNGGSACDFIGLTKFIANKKLNYIFVEYPGYAGDNEKPTQERVLKNALDVFHYVQENLNKTNLPIFAHGVSIGTGVVTWLASQVILDGIILHAPYTSMKDVADGLFPMGGSMVDKYTFMAKDWAPNVEEPVLALHAKNDRVIKFKLGEKQMKNFTHARNTKWVPFEDGDHMSILNQEKYWNSVVAFVNETLGF